MENYRRHRILALIILPFILLGAYNAAAYGHYHKLNDNSITYHSHPYSDSSCEDTPFQDHKHTDFEYLLLDQITNIFNTALVAVVAAFLLITLRKEYLYKKFEERLHPSLRPLLQTLRGPPKIKLTY